MFGSFRLNNINTLKIHVVAAEGNRRAGGWGPVSGGRFQNERRGSGTGEAPRHSRAALTRPAESPRGGPTPHVSAMKSAGDLRGKRSAKLGVRPVLSVRVTGARNLEGAACESVIAERAPVRAPGGPPASPRRGRQRLRVWARGPCLERGRRRTAEARGGAGRSEPDDTHCTDQLLGGLWAG